MKLNEKQKKELEELKAQVDKDVFKEFKKKFIEEYKESQLNELNKEPSKDFSEKLKVGFAKIGTKLAENGKQFGSNAIKNVKGNNSGFGTSRGFNFGEKTSRIMGNNSTKRFNLEKFK